MGVPLDEALRLAREAKEMGRLNPYPQACITLAAEVMRLRALQENESNACPQAQQVIAAESPAGTDGDNPQHFPDT